MERLPGGFLAWFWFLLAASVPVNLLIYRPVFESLAHDKSVGRDAYGAYRIMMVGHGGAGRFSPPGTARH